MKIFFTSAYRKIFLCTYLALGFDSVLSDKVQISISEVDVAKANQGGIALPNSVDDIEGYLAKIQKEMTGGGRQGEEEHRQLGACNSNNDHQTVYLDFPNRARFYATLFDFSSTFQSYIFTEEDQQILLKRFEADFDGFNVDFVLEEPSGCSYSTLTFAAPEDLVTIGANGGRSILFGRADQIDHFNKDQTDNAFVDANFWTWIIQFPFWRNRLRSFFRFSGLDPATPIEEAVRTATLNQAGNTGAHELGHILGLRHYDSFGSQGANGGFLSFTYLDGLVDIRPDNQDGTETLLHIMASGASVGLSLPGIGGQDRFFSERSAIKILLGSRDDGGLTYSEQAAKAKGGAIGSNQPGLDLKHLTVPNTIIAGQFAGRNLATSVAVVEGAHIDYVEEVDQYRFRFEKGQFINVEVIGWLKARAAVFEDLVITSLSISKDNGDGTLDQLITSHQEFEGLDPLIFDFEIPESGDYVLEVFPQTFICLQGDCFVIPDVYNYGEYDMFVYSIDRALGPPN